MIGAAAGPSCLCANGYDADTLAEDLTQILHSLNLRDVSHSLRRHMRPAAFQTPFRIVRPAILILAAQNSYAFGPSFTKLTLSPVGRRALF